MPELWYSAAPAYESKSSKSIIHRFVVKGHTGLTINPYQGCQHRCAYCYATYEWSPEFYDRIYAKINAAEVLEKEMASWKHGEIDPVMIGPDPFRLDTPGKRYLHMPGTVKKKGGSDHV